MERAATNADESVFGRRSRPRLKPNGDALLLMLGERELFVRHADGHGVAV